MSEKLTKSYKEEFIESHPDFIIFNNGSTAYFPMENIVEDYELQYDDNHEVVKVKTGETDLLKTAQSGFDKVGLLNVAKAAIARGEDPLTCFAKREPGVPVAMPINSTMDDINEVIQADSQKFEAIAQSLGCSVDEVKVAMANGTINQLIEKATAKKSDEEGGAE